MKKREYIYNVYNFLNNTYGEIDEVGVKELLLVLNCEKEYYNVLKQEDITYLSDSIRSGDEEEEFYSYLESIVERV